MIIAQIIERLRAQTDTPFAIVEGAAELASLGNAQPNALPAAYVFTAEEAAEPNDRIGAVLQRLEIDVAVVIVAGNVSDATGAAAASDMESLKRAARKALVGWQPPAADDVVTNVGARIVRVRDGAVWCEMTFATARYETDQED
ncbi:phage tail terminator protein [Methylorubrum extorquens]|uniref:phage tail terminator protein n=1 Tax=Methylorubrum extorquens TaxID=408 RepID=UPI003F62337A